MALLLLVGCAGTPVVASGNAYANPDYSSLVVDANTGQVISARNADAQRYPASLTKMMTLYLLFEAMENGKYTTNSSLRVSANAASQAPSKLGAPAGTSITVDTAIKALVTRSANDVAVVVAENMAGSESAFAQRMTAKARALGMTNTTFRNASGLPNTGQVTTARDMVTLGMALQRHFPKHYPYFSITSFKYGGQTISTHNHVLRQYRGADGLKTGYIRASGFNVVTSAKRGDVRLVAAVMGGRTAKSRDDHMMELLDQGFVEMDRQRHTGRVASAASSRITVAELPVSRGQARSEVGVSAVAPPRPAPLKPGAGSAGVQVAMAGGAGAAPLLLAPTAKPGAIVPAVVSNNAPRPPSATPQAKGGLAAPAADLAAPHGSGDQAGSAPVASLTAAPHPGGSWGIQVGAFAQADRAQAFAGNAYALLGGHYDKTALAPLVVPAAVNNGTVYRARLFGLADEQDARKACVVLAQANWSCLVVNPAGDNVLAR